MRCLIAILFLALLGGVAVAYGTDPRLGGVSHGLDVIIWSRRLQWPLVGLTTVAALGVVVLAVTKKGRLWALLGLAPVLMLFVQRFAGGRPEELSVRDEPPFVEAAKADFVAPDDWVVSLTFAGTNYAYPYAAIFHEPVVVQTDHDQKLVLFWNVYANRALAFNAANELRGRNLEIVSTPANGLLVYNRSRGQFIFGMTGQTSAGPKATGLAGAVMTSKSTFVQWKAAHPTGKVMRPSERFAWRGPAPTQPQQPRYAMAPGPNLSAVDAARTSATSRPAESAPKPRGVLVGTSKPLLVVGDLPRGPVAALADDRPAVLLSDEVTGGPAFRAFVRQVDDMVLRVELPGKTKLQDVRFHDLETDCLWSSHGVAVGGNVFFRGRKLAPLPVDSDVNLSVARWWMPQLTEYTAPAPPVKPVESVAAATPDKTAKSRPAPTRKKSSGKRQTDVVQASEGGAAKAPSQLAPIPTRSPSAAAPTAAAPASESKGRAGTAPLVTQTPVVESGTRKKPTKSKPPRSSTADARD